MRYTTAADVKAYPSIPSNATDAFINKLIDRASAYITTQTNRRFGYDPAATPAVPYEVVTDELYTPGNWGGFYLKNFDVQAITSVKVGPNQTVLAADGYTFDPSTGRFYLGGYGEDVRVSYTYGYEGIPADIQYACEALVIGIYQILAGKGAVNSERTGNYQISYNTSKITMPNVPPDVDAILKAYRIIHI